MGEQKRRIRVGFISRYFYDHSIGRVNAGLIEHLSREHFHTTVLRLPTRDDARSAAIYRSADRDQSTASIDSEAIWWQPAEPRPT